MNEELKQRAIELMNEILSDYSGIEWERK